MRECNNDPHCRNFKPSFYVERAAKCNSAAIDFALGANP